ATRTLQVRVLVNNTNGKLRPEMYASVEIEQSSAREAVLVPEAAVQNLSGQSVVFVRTASDRFEPRAVQTGRSEGGSTEIPQGLRPGEQVVVRGGFLLKSHLMKDTLE
ncbi:MAG: efflux RND transporter periplasmic adaptor subunit, partial [Bryobacteraceae bacterium]